MNIGEVSSLSFAQQHPFASFASTAQTAAVEVHKLKKNYGLKPVLRGVNLTLQRGERVALLGANGVGKTTLLRILAGLAKPSSGTVTIFGLDSAREMQMLRRYIGFVAHQPYLYEELTALENLLFFARMYSVKQAQKRATELLHRVGLEKRMHERVHALSRGQLQRLSWARALLHAPGLLLLDEPETGLDQQAARLIDELLAEHISLGGSVLFSTHVLERALQASDAVALLHEGRIVQQQVTQAMTVERLRSLLGGASQ